MSRRETSTPVAIVATSSHTLWNNELKARNRRWENTANLCDENNPFTNSPQSSPTIYKPNMDLSPIIIGGPGSDSPPYNNALNQLPEPPPSPQPKREPKRVSPKINGYQLFQPKNSLTEVRYLSIKDQQKELGKLRTRLESIKKETLKLASEIIASSDLLTSISSWSWPAIKKASQRTISENLHQIASKGESLDDWIAKHNIPEKFHESINQLIDLEDKKYDIQERINKLEAELNPPKIEARPRRGKKARPPQRKIYPRRVKAYPAQAKIYPRQAKAIPQPKTLQC